MTEYLQVDAQEPDLELLERAAKILRDGGIVAFPTETVYGLGVAASCPEAVERLRFVKNRPEDKPFTHLLSSAAAVGELLEEIPPRAQALMNRYWPGPLTLILPRTRDSDEMVGVRLSASPVAIELVRLAQVPILAPSANPSGQPPATSADEVRKYFDSQVDAVLDAGTVTLKEPSTVVRVTYDRCEVLRVGIITAEMVHQLVSGKTILFVCTGNTCRSPMAAALFRKHMAEKLGKSTDELSELGYRIASAGTFTSYANRASQGAVETMKEKGIDISNHVSQPVTRELLREADRVYAMTRSQLDVLSDLEGTVANRAFVLSEDGIADPIGGDLAIYQDCGSQIERAVEKLVREL